MSFVIRPLFALAALALATPAFAADIGNGSTPMAAPATAAAPTASVSAPVTSPAAPAKTEAKADVKTPATPKAKSTSAETKKSEPKKVSEVTHHHVKTTKHA